jgi:hypothetical protein
MVTKKPVLFWIYRKFADVPFNIKVSRVPVVKDGYEVKGPFLSLAAAVLAANGVSNG